MTNTTKAYAAILAVAFASLAAGCSGGSSAAGSSAGTGTNVSASGAASSSSSVQILGVATPSSVSVVTATNQ